MYGEMDKDTVVPRVSVVNMRVSTIGLGEPGGRAGWNISLGNSGDSSFMVAKRAISKGTPVRSLQTTSKTPKGKTWNTCHNDS